MDVLRCLFSRQAHHRYIKTIGYDHDDEDDGTIEQQELDPESRYKSTPRSTTTKSNLKPFVCGISLAIGTLFLIWSLLQHQLSQIQTECSSPQQATPSLNKSCGATPTEARSLGCRFEMHNFAWVPPVCYDDLLGDEWDANPDWGFSRSANDSTDTDAQYIAECRAGNVSAAWVPWRQHMAHCALILKKYLRAVGSDGPMDSFTADWAHAKHCTDMMLKRDVGMDMFNSLLHLKFPVCDYGWKGEWGRA